MDQVIIEFQLTPDEGRRAQLGPSPKKNRAIMVICVGSALILTVSIFGKHEPVVSIVLAIVEVVFLTYFLAARFWLAPRRYWRATPGVNEATIVTVDGQGIVSKSDSAEIRYEWSQFSGTRETGAFYFLLPMNGAAALALPKRGLQSTEDTAKLRHLLESHGPLSSEDRLLRPGLARKLVLLSLVVILITFIYVVVRVH